ncbi:MAG TPA: sulfite exporter TauE/SafE family protein [Aliiroseovarius sp.]|nr:sulfite exporter TauE/SafE family protein [Aliiroseovarius sp.]
MDLDALSYLYIGLAALLVGFTKTSVGGVGILAVLLMALAIPGKASPGVLLPMLIIADLMAVAYYRRSCQWALLRRLLPLTFIGVVLGAGLLWVLPDSHFERWIGWIILAMLGFDLALSEAAKALAKGKVITALAGLIAGASSMLANAAGPVFGVYLLQMGLSKSAFVGTRSWFFLIMNIAKVPFAVALGLITPTSLSLNLFFLPVIILGAVLGRVFLRYINISVFKVLIRLAVLASAIRLIMV